MHNEVRITPLPSVPLSPLFKGGNRRRRRNFPGSNPALLPLPLPSIRAEKLRTRPMWYHLFYATANSKFYPKSLAISRVTITAALTAAATAAVQSLIG